MRTERAYKSGENLIVGESGSETVCSFPAGKVSCLLAPCKSGKTHFLRGICGLEKSDLKVFCGDELTGLSAKERDMSVIFSACSLFGGKTVWDNTAYVLEIRGIEREIAAEIAREAAEKAGLGAIVDSKAKKLNAYEKFAAETARAYARRPRAVLIDEPFLRTGLKFREQTAALMANLAEVSGAPVVFACSSPEDAFRFSEYVAVLDEGKVSAAGSAAEIFNNPPDAFSARTDGAYERSFFKVEKSKNAVLFPGVKLDFGGDALPDFDCAYLAAACDDIYLSPEGFKCLVSFAEETEKGSLIYADFDISGLGDDAGKFTFLASPEQKVKVNDVLKVDFKRENLLFFDCATGKRLKK